MGIAQHGRRSGVNGAGLTDEPRKLLRGSHARGLTTQRGAPTLDGMRHAIACGSRGREVCRGVVPMQEAP